MTASDLEKLSRLRDEVRERERDTHDARARRDNLAAWMCDGGRDAKVVGAAAGLAPSYVELLARRRRAAREMVGRQA